MWEAYGTGGTAIYDKWTEGMVLFKEWLEQYKKSKDEKEQTAT